MYVYIYISLYIYMHPNGTAPQSARNAHGPHRPMRGQGCCVGCAGRPPGAAVACSARCAAGGPRTASPRDNRVTTGSVCGVGRADLGAVPLAGGRDREEPVEPVDQQLRAHRRGAMRCEALCARVAPPNRNGPHCRGGNRRGKGPSARAAPAGRQRQRSAQTRATRAPQEQPRPALPGRRERGGHMRYSA